MSCWYVVPTQPGVLLGPSALLQWPSLTNLLPCLIIPNSIVSTIVGIVTFTEVNTYSGHKCSNSMIAQDRTPDAKQRSVIGEEYGGWQRFEDDCKPFTTNRRRIYAKLWSRSSLIESYICSTMQCRVPWVRNRSQSFTNITASLDDLEWKRNLTLSFGSHFIAPLKRFSYTCSWAGLTKTVLKRFKRF